jgi:hypothetical protein
MSEKTITINGTIYDAHTGMPLHKVEAPLKTQEKPAAPHHAQIHHSQAIHHSIQKSQTLNRRVVKKTAAKQKLQPVAAPIQKSPSITRFAPHPTGVTKPVRSMDIAPVAHPMATKAHKQMEVVAQQKAAAPKMSPKPSQIIKQEAVAEALEKAPSHNAPEKTKRTKKHPRLLSIASASLALLLLGGYFTYLNMPSLSVRVAAAQAGVNANYPEYRPDGYSLNGPVAYTQGEVSMKFASNGGPQNFTVSQAKSNWDSSAVLDNYVKEKAGDSYITYNERGLTIYTFDGNAAWVNGGVLYTITGNAPLSSDQIRRIATSM